MGLVCTAAETVCFWGQDVADYSDLGAARSCGRDNRAAQLRRFTVPVSTLLFTMSTDPLLFACLHLPTTAEQERDPGYRGCGAQAGQACQWSRRNDGVTDPAFHAERLEAAAQGASLQETLDTETFREAVLDTGLV